MTKKIFNYVIYRNNPYHALLYCGLTGRYAAERGVIEDAVTAQAAAGGGEPEVFHLHCEEYALRTAKTSAEAFATTDYLLDAVDRFQALGGKVVWTIHNETPHELEHVDAFLAMRRGLIERCDRICVHNLRSIEVLTAQGPLLPDRLYYLPHPSYSGLYEALPPSGEASKTVLIFGMIRRYKGLGPFLKGFRDSGLAEKGVRVRLSGEPLGGDGYADELIAEHGQAPGVDFDIRRIPEAEVATLFRDSACLVLPYERFLSSGALLAAMTCGAPVVGPNSSPLAEVLPPENLPFLYEEGAPGDIFTRIDAMVGLPEDARRTLRDAALARAAYLHPERISRQLGALYDDLLGRGG